MKEAFAEVSKGNIKAANFDLNGLWSPWYTLHKTFAGLRDAYRHTGNQTALDIEVKFAQWAETYLAPMDDATVQRMLATEFGGMNEMMADLYADTGDKRWLELSYKFEHKAVLDPLKRGEDPLSSLHGNTQVPKLIGSAARYAYAGDKDDLDRRDLLLGSRRQSPHLRHRRPRQGRILPRARQAGQHHRRPHRRDLQRLQHAQADAEAVRAAARHPLRRVPRARAVQSHPRIDGPATTARPATWCRSASGVRREYADMYRSFTCCVGTGMESHALHGLGLYYEAGDKLWVNLYAPSTAQWEAAGVKLTMETTFPEGEAATLTLDLRAPKAFTLALRRPSWAANGFACA